MQLKLTRSQRTGGLGGGTMFFCLDARVQLTPEESQSVTRYKLQNQVIYSSEAQKRAAEGSALSAAQAKAQGIGFGNADDFLTSATGKIGHGLKALALGAISAMRLTITIKSLQDGQHIECKSLDELLGAEDALMDACQNLKQYLDTAATFDGREVIVDFATGAPEIIEQAITPKLVAPPPLESRPPPATPVALSSHAKTADPSHTDAPTYAATTTTEGQSNRAIAFIAAAVIIVLAIVGWRVTENQQAERTAQVERNIR